MMVTVTHLLKGNRNYLTAKLATYNMPFPVQKNRYADVLPELLPESVQKRSRRSAKRIVVMIKPRKSDGFVPEQIAAFPPGKFQISQRVHRPDDFRDCGNLQPRLFRQMRNLVRHIRGSRNLFQKQKGTLKNLNGIFYHSFCCLLRGKAIHKSF